MQTSSPLPIIPLSRNSRIDSTHLELVRDHLHGNPLAIEYLGSMLRYANTLLRASERHCRSPYDQPRAEVIYGNTTFLFSRMNASTKGN